MVPTTSSEIRSGDRVIPDLNLENDTLEVRKRWALMHNWPLRVRLVVGQKWLTLFDEKEGRQVILGSDASGLASIHHFVKVD